MVARSLIATRPCYLASLAWTWCTDGPQDSQLEQSEQALEDLTLDSMQKMMWHGDQVELPEESQDVIADFLGRINLDALIKQQGQSDPKMQSRLVHRGIMEEESFQLPSNIEITDMMSTSRVIDAMWVFSDKIDDYDSKTFSHIGRRFDFDDDDSDDEHSQTFDYIGRRFDFDNDDNYTVTSFERFWSVPYAFVSKKDESINIDSAIQALNDKIIYLKDRDKDTVIGNEGITYKTIDSLNQVLQNKIDALRANDLRPIF